MVDHPPTIDVAVLSRDLAPLDPRVERAIRAQSGVNVRLHRIVGTRVSSDQNRFQTIARARNEAKSTGSTPWLMFVDDDVVIPPNCLQQLIERMMRAPAMGAMGAHYLSCCPADDGLHGHVSMGATLFRRAALKKILFREEGSCDCQSCCNDLRRQGWGIAYAAGLRAIHLDLSDAADRLEQHQVDRPATIPSADAAFVLAGFDGRHCDKFRNRFLASLRSAGNDEQVIAVATGLSASDARALTRHRRLTLIEPTDLKRHIAVDRYFYFRDLVSDLPRHSRMAYWDAGDCLFQQPLTDLWRQVEQHPTRVLVVAEPWSRCTFETRGNWVLKTRADHQHARLFGLLRYKPVINAGFAAGTYKAFQRFLDGICRWMDSPTLYGMGWGTDQIAMMAHLYESNAYHFADEGWNYCLTGREPHETVFTKHGTIHRMRDGRVIPVVHGNGATLERFWTDPERSDEARNSQLAGIERHLSPGA